MDRLTQVSRIISGAVGSLRLKPAAKVTRPTSDRVKESLFSTLESMGVLEGAEVLDLYAGTGALGLESASRGAKSVVLVERNPIAAQICQENSRLVSAGLLKAGLEIEIRVVRQAVEKFCEKSPRATLVFIDPPYEQSNEQIHRHLCSLAANSELMVVLERSSRTPAPEIPEGLELHSQKDYGDTRIYFLARGFSR